VKGLLIVKFKDLKDAQDKIPPIIVKSTFDMTNDAQAKEATNYGIRLSQLAIHSRDLVRDLDPSNDLTFLRVSCKKFEMMIAPDKNYFLIVIQEPDEANTIPVAAPKKEEAAPAQASESKQ
jgi:hypothetical protein